MSPETTKTSGEKPEKPLTPIPGQSVESAIILAAPDQLTPEQLEVYFAELVESHSWSTVKIDRNGLQFSWKYVLKKDWQWLAIVKPPKIHTIPDILTPGEVEQLIGATRKLRYRVFTPGVVRPRSAFPVITSPRRMGGSHISSSPLTG